MTNNWTDIANATLIIVMGANPAENHPASIAHIHGARRGPHTDAFGTNSKPAAKLVVIEPRKTRTAAIADMFVRIRPGTDIAFINGVVNWIVNNISGAQKTKFEEYLNSSTNRTFQDDAGGTVSVPGCSIDTDARMIVNATGADYERGTRTIGAQTISNFPLYAADIYTDLDATRKTVYNRLVEHVAPYTTSVVADICGCTEAQLIEVAQLIIDNSLCSSVDGVGAFVYEPRSQFHRVTTFMYAMGLTQHTHGSQNVKSFAVLQTMMGNVGRAGGGINALRGIHNVQGSTDMGLLYHLIPGYSGNPTGTFGVYMDRLYGVRLSGGATAYDDAYDPTKHGLQQAGFYQMTRKFFGDTTLTARADIDKIFNLWPKGAGTHHIQMFRDMAASTIKACVVWGQNPAVTEPNLSKIRDGLRELDLLVCVDMFENETAACDRKATGVTYLIPACSHVEEAGSATNSGRVLQWRYQAIPPKGNSRTDMELLLRFAYAIQQNGGFAHISNVWNTISGFTYSTVYDKLYGSQYGWTPGGGAFSSEAAASAVYQQMCMQVNAADPTQRGTLWIYTLGYSTVLTGQGGGWTQFNRAKERNNVDSDGSGGGHQLYKNWGYAWLVNRRVLYNNGRTPWDQTDAFQGPDQCARLYVTNNGNLIDYARNYRTYHRLADVPDTGIGTVHKLPGRFPAHTEPYESPRDGTGAGTNLVSTWGYNTKGTGAGDLLLAGSGRGTAASYPLVLTTFRCVEHFQGGPITRNNKLNVEAEPEPWIEINSADARNFGIAHGDMVKITSARGNSSQAPVPPQGAGFRARVGVGLSSNQRVGPGVVAVPWHWGEKGLSNGSRANDLTIDAMDANTMIPEYKACLCKIEKMT